MRAERCATHAATSYAPGTGPPATADLIPALPSPRRWTVVLGRVRGFAAIAPSRGFQSVGSPARPSAAHASHAPPRPPSPFDMRPALTDTVPRIPCAADRGKWIGATT